jgi:hypothetical protein
MIDNDTHFDDAFKSLQAMFGLKDKKKIVSGEGKLLQVVLERDAVCGTGFSMIMSGVMLGVKDHLNTTNVTCKITVGYIYPKLPIQYAVLNGTYYDEWKFSYKE